MDERDPLTMTIDMAVMDSLGIKLYSNAAAVLTELVANAYDADATLISIAWHRGNPGESSVIISDDGHGMTRDEMDERFLTTGYQKRHPDAEGFTSQRWRRPFMGRKGIGMLSMFSIAGEIEVYTSKAGERTGCNISADKLREHIQSKQAYHPPYIEVPEDHPESGTKIVLRQLKTKRVAITAAALRKRLARRFDVLDQTPREAGGFKIEIDGQQVTFEDRQDLKQLEYIWEFGTQRLPDSALPKVLKRFTLPQYKVDDRDDWEVRGWIGTARTPSDLVEDDEAGSLKNVMILARKRPIHEGILDKLDFSRVFGNYVTGQVAADFLDVDNADDIATSDRQRLIEDDERVRSLQRFLRDAFQRASNEWNAERPKKKAKDAFEQFPALREWRDSLPGWQQEPANKMISTIAALPMDRGNERANRASLYRSGVLAFARIGLREKSDELDQLSTLDAEHLLQLFGAQEAYEASLWADILRGRIEAIQKLDRHTDDNVLEKVVQKHVYKNLWLLDPSWERATEDSHMEQRLSQFAPDIFPMDERGDEITGRIDIRYRKAAGAHVIVELKRYGRSSTIDDLIAQGKKYWGGLSSVLEQQNRSGEPIEVVFVLGQAPRVVSSQKYDDNEYITRRLAEIDGRYVLYRELVRNASSQYKEYLDATLKVHELERLLETLEAE